MAAFKALALLFAFAWTCQAHAQEGIFWKKKDLLEHFFRKSEKVTGQDITLTPAQKQAIRKQIGYAPDHETYTFFVGQTAGKADGYVLFDEQLGQHKLISYAVHISPEGGVLDAEIMIYREPQGGEVGNKRFLKQYHGKTIHSPLRVNSDIVHITGATISSKSITAGVKRALAVWEAAYGAKKNKP